MRSILHMLERFFSFIRSLFISGLLTLLPLTLTVALFNVSFKLLKSWLAPIHALEPEILTRIPHSEIILVVVAILLVGLVLKLFLAQPIIHALEGAFKRIPLVRQVYFGIKQMVHAFTSKEQDSFQSVAWVEFPRKGVYSLGFMTGKVDPRISPDPQSTYYNFFIPTTPNPTTGYYVIVPAHECMFTTFSRQEAMSLVISGGIIQPEGTEHPTDK